MLGGEGFNMSFWEQFKKQLIRSKSSNISESTASQPPELTPREADVFRCLVEGYTLQETADQLGIKYSTANTHMTSIYKKLGVNSRAELIIHYRNFENKEN